MNFSEFRQQADDLALQMTSVDSSAVAQLRNQWDQVKAGYLPQYQQLIEDRLQLAESYVRQAKHP